MIKREYRCFYEGQQEKMYFDHIAKKVKEANSNISLKFKKFSKLKTLEKSSTDVPKIAVFDYDLNKVDFESKVKICKETRILYSNLNFDLWLVLHKKKYGKKVQNNDAYINEVRNLYELPNTASIKTKGNIEKILQKIELVDVKRAIKNAEEIMNGKMEEEKIYVNNFSYYLNPSMTINEFFKELFQDIGI